jgi:hypothetical protein
MLVNSADAPIELVTSPWATTFYGLVQLVQEELLVVSPFISREPLKSIVGVFGKNHSLGSIRVDIVTNLAVGHLLAGSLDVAALLYLAQSIPNATVTYLPGLHAKIYVADTKAAVITSANLTSSGLSGNHEYGVLLRDPALVSKTRSDLTKYAALGSKVSLDTLTALSEATQDLKIVRQAADKSINAQLKATFEQRVEEAKLELLKARAKGTTTHGIFSDTILYLLGEKGPLMTIELHPLIQQIHPDLCDDSIDRVIEGVHFGKKWKHHVRNAQQALRRQGLIDFDGQRWFRLA